MSANDYLVTVHKVYIAYYGRPADVGGLAYWAARLDHEGGNLSAIIEAFANSYESQQLYGSLSTSQKITQIYEQLFGRDPDPAGLQFYTQMLATGKMTQASIMLNVLDGAQSTDLQLINGKVLQSEHAIDANALAAQIDRYEKVLSLPAELNGIPIIAGTPGDDTFTFTGGGDKIYLGLGGNDTFIKSAGGMPVFVGGPGADTYYVGAGYTGGIIVYDLGASAGDRIVAPTTGSGGAAIKIGDFLGVNFYNSLGAQVGQLLLPGATSTDNTIETLIHSFRGESPTLSVGDVFGRAAPVSVELFASLLPGGMVTWQLFQDELVQLVGVNNQYLAAVT